MENWSMTLTRLMKIYIGLIHFQIFIGCVKSRCLSFQGPHLYFQTTYKSTLFRYERNRCFFIKAPPMLLSIFQVFRTFCIFLPLWELFFLRNFQMLETSDKVVYYWFSKKTETIKLHKYITSQNAIWAVEWCHS